MDFYFCKHCFENPKSDKLCDNGLVAYERIDDLCPTCGGKLVETVLDSEEYFDLAHISPDPSFIKAMIDLKEKDVIEFNLKMSQFRANGTDNSAEPDNSPKCSTCGSTNLSPISNAKKAAKILAFGVFGMGDNGKTWKCNNCGSKW